MKITLHVLWWDVLLNRRFLQRFRTPYLPRWQQIARDFRLLAVEMGGVLIKLGQFLSVRVDILPLEVTSELSGLQDEVPPEPLVKVVRQIESDFGRPIADLFTWFSPKVLGAASLGQTHKARLHSGEMVVVKVLRPDIESTVETDLIAIEEFIRRLKYYKRISRSVDLNRLAEEFSRVTRQELNLSVEGQSSERFAQNFAENEQIYVPKIYWDYTATHTLTMENVGYISIDDLAQLQRMGIEPSEVARVLSRAYLEQFFIHHFVHVDPHSGNLFIKPLPYPGERINGTPVNQFRPGEPVPYHPNRSFQIVFIDFGMAVEITGKYRSFLRNYMIGVGTRDAPRIVQSYVDGDMLLPNADLDRIEELMDDILKQYGETLFGQAQNLDLLEYNDFFIQEYRDVVYDSPFQFPTDLLFIFRAMGLLSGMSAQLDPNINSLDEVMPFVQRLLQEEAQSNWQDWVSEAVNYGQIALQLPKRIDDVFKQAQRGRLTVKTSLAPDARKNLSQLNQSVNRLGWMVVSAALLLSGAILHVGTQVATALSGTVGAEGSLGLWLMGGAVVLFVWGLRRR